MSGVNSPECLGSVYGDQSCPPFKVNSLLKVLHCKRGYKPLRKDECSARFQRIRVLDSTFCWGGRGAEVSEMIRYMILCLSAKAINQFLSVYQCKWHEA